MDVSKFARGVAARFCRRIGRAELRSEKLTNAYILDDAHMNHRVRRRHEYARLGTGNHRVRRWQEYARLGTGNDTALRRTW